MQSEGSQSESDQAATSNVNWAGCDEAMALLQCSLVLLVHGALSGRRHGSFLPVGSAVDNLGSECDATDDG